MNDRSIETFAADGGKDLIGRNLLGCHPEPSRTLFAELLESGASNIYTIEKGGRKKLIAQLPWRKDGVYQGLVELSIELPDAIPHFNRDAKPTE